MGHGQRLRTRRSADVRVLKAQLDLIADVIHSARYTAPLWALAVATLGSKEVGAFGNLPLHATLISALAVTLVSVFAERLVILYRREAARQVSFEQLQSWFLRFLAVQFAFGCAWGLVPWLLWVPGDKFNHITLATCLVGVLGGIVINRAGNLAMLVASALALSTLGALRFAFGDNIIDFGIAAFLLLATMQFIAVGRRLTRRLDEDTRLRFEVEDLAQELEHAHDEALRKRFEAETANSSKTAFLANMSHELRTPLNAILGFSEIIAKECFGAIGSLRYTEYAADIHSSGTHLLSLINDLLDVAKIESGRMEIEPEILDTRQAFVSALKLVGAKARDRRQELVVEIAPSAPPLFADERALKQILINLVSNAVKFTPEGGRIAVLGTRSPCGGFQLVVEDNGPGIPREKLDKIFEPFSQVDNRYDRQGGGTGLGLALVRGLAELHGGRAWLESEPGMGCRALVVLPVAESAKSAAA